MNSILNGDIVSTGNPNGVIIATYGSTFHDIEGGFKYQQTLKPHGSNWKIFDAEKFLFLPTSLPPDGPAGGHLSGTYPNPALHPDLFRLIANTASTGLIYFGGITINADTKKFDLGEIKCWFIDSTTTPETPLIIFKTFPAREGVPVNNLAILPGSFIGIDVNGVIHQQAASFTNTQSQTIIQLAGISHPNFTTIQAVNPRPGVITSPALSVRALMRALGSFSVTGNVFSANGANLLLNKSSGIIFDYGDNYEHDPLDPHSSTYAALTGFTFQYRNSTTSFVGGNTTAVDPNTWESPLGTNATANNNKFTIQRIWLNPENVVRLQYGQVQYSSMAVALAALDGELYTNNPTLADRGLLRGYIIIEKGTSDMTDITKCIIKTASKFPL